MTAAPILPSPALLPLTADLVSAAKRRAYAASQPSWARAIQRAADKSAATTAEWRGATLVVASATTSGLHYEVDGAGCTCAAGMQGDPCWHRALRRMQRIAAQAAAPAPAAAQGAVMTASQRAKAQADVDAFFE